MARFVRGADRDHVTPLPNRLDAYLSEDDPGRVVDVFVDALDLAARGFEGVVPAATGRPGYHPATLPQRDRRSTGVLPGSPANGPPASSTPAAPAVRRAG